MSRAAVELDFFSMERETASNLQAKKPFDRRRSFRDIQSVISKINPELLKNVIASGSVTKSSMGQSVEKIPSAPKDDQNAFPALPVFTPRFRPGGVSSGESNPPLTIFYNGAVSVFDVSPHQAENILKLAREGGVQDVESTDSKLAVSSNVQQRLMETFNEDLPFARRKSFQRFLEKRKDRQTTVSPYGCPTDKAVSHSNNSRGKP